jgi:hypothetical protein
MLESLRSDNETLTEILESNRSVSLIGVPSSLRIPWTIYLTILEDSIKVLRAMIEYLEREKSG